MVSWLSSDWFFEMLGDEWTNTEKVRVMREVETDPETGESTVKDTPIEENKMDTLLILGLCFGGFILGREFFGMKGQIKELKKEGERRQQQIEAIMLRIK